MTTKEDWSIDGGVLLDLGFDFRAEMPEQALDGPSCRVAQSTNGVALNLLQGRSF
jgi:hypothetical protein